MGCQDDVSETTKMRIVSLFKAGKIQWFISDQVKVLQSTVSKDLKEYRRASQLKNKQSKYSRIFVMTASNECKL